LGLPPTSTMRQAIRPTWISSFHCLIFGADSPTTGTCRLDDWLVSTPTALDFVAGMSWYRWRPWWAFVVPADRAVLASRAHRDNDCILQETRSSMLAVACDCWQAPRQSLEAVASAWQTPHRPGHW
jgi:hypothetical protein